jgi:hypothetical protein
LKAKDIHVLPSGDEAIVLFALEPSLGAVSALPSVSSPKALCWSREARAGAAAASGYGRRIERRRANRGGGGPLVFFHCAPQKPGAGIDVAADCREICPVAAQIAQESSAR